jgi:arginine/lysine/ornithine decarboxylase
MRFLLGLLASLSFAQRIEARTPFLSALLRVRELISPSKQFFFPGHSSGRFANRELDMLDLFQHDLPELDGLDNIHAPEGPLLESLELAAKLYDAKQSWFLVNGSTGGLLSAILAMASSLGNPWGSGVNM